MNVTKSNSTETELEYLNIDLNVLQKVVLVTIWIVIQVPGNLMLFGLIHFDKFGGDPLKRRMIDQVKQSLMSLSFEEFVQITGLKNQNKIVKMEIVVY